jgi:hypothetical protein
MSNSVDKSHKKSFDLAMKYLKKYRDTIGFDMTMQLVKEYADADTVIYSINTKLSDAEQEELFELIDNSKLLSFQAKAETIAGLWMVMEGSFPSHHVLIYMKKVFGSDFVKAIEEKREEKNKWRQP